LRNQVTLISSLVAILAAALTVQAQSPITSVTLGPDQIAVVRTAQGISTRISFPEPVTEIICGDLFDAASGKGSFVVQRGENDVFIKPIVPKGVSNLFVKTGDKGEHVYNFDLSIVPGEQAFRVVNVTWPAPKGQRKADRTASEQEPEREPAKDSQQQVAEILRGARTQAKKLVADAERQAAVIDQNSADRADREVERRFINAVMLGLRETKTGNAKSTGKKLLITLDPRLLVFADKTYLRFTIQNSGSADFIFSDITIESAEGNALIAEVVFARNDKRIGAGEAVVGAVVFDSKLVRPKDRVSMSVRAEDRTEAARLNVVL
jgi:hypothetical protein